MRRHFYIHTLFFLHFQIWPFWPQEPKNSNLTNSFLTHYPQPKMNQKSPKDPKLILILIIKLLYTYFWKMLPVGALIWLAPIWLMSPNRATHLKSPKKDLGLPFTSMQIELFMHAFLHDGMLQTSWFQLNLMWFAMFWNHYEYILKCQPVEPGAFLLSRIAKVRSFLVGCALSHLSHTTKSQSRFLWH